ncbi:MAG: DoxX family protein [Rhodothermales bacterium]
MNAIQKLVNWLDTYREVAFDLLRIYLGVGLFVRGVLFFYDSSAYVALLPSDAGALLTSSAFLYTVAGIHVVGGALIAAGFWTRLAALAQIPILVGAVFLSMAGLFSANQSFEFSALVLFLLVLVFVYGSGRWSVEHYWGRGRMAFQKLLDKLYGYRGTAFDLLRIYLGIGLFVRGGLFIADSGAFIRLLSPDPGSLLTSAVVVHCVALAHIFGGAMMVAGLLTRLAALIQIPVLVGAVFVSQLQGGLLSADQSFEFSALVLFLLVLIFLYGSGQWSADHYFFVRRAGADAELTGQSEGARAILEREIPEDIPVVAPSDVLTADPAVGTRTLTRDDPMVAAQARYSFWGWFLFLVDVTPRPREIVFRNIKTGEIVERSRDPEVLDKYRYH